MTRCKETHRLHVKEHHLISDLLGLPAQTVAEKLNGYTLRRLSGMTLRELEDVGLTPARARRLHCAFDLARQYSNIKRLRRGAAFTTPRQIFEAYQTRFREEMREHFLTVTLDARHRVMSEHVISIGSLTSSIVHPREVFRPAVREAAGAIVLVHNHPSGDPSPSDEDVAVTRRLVHASELLGIRVLDHVIVGDAEYASLKELGLL